MILIPLGVIFGGYTLLWYGYITMQTAEANGIGIADLVLPSRINKVENVQFTAGKQGNGKIPPGSSVPGSGPKGGTQPGGLPPIFPGAPGQIGNKGGNIA